MKKVLCLLLFAIFLPLNTPSVSAQFTMQDILKASRDAFITTDDYSKIINNHHYDVAKIRLSDCERLSKQLDFILDNTQGKNEIECVMLSSIIIMEREFSLDYYVKAIDAYNANNQALFNEYNQKMYRQAVQAVKSRQEFLRKYGF